MSLPTITAAAATAATTTTSSSTAATIATSAAPAAAATTTTTNEAKAAPPRLLQTAAILNPRKGDVHRNTIIWMHGLGDSSDGFRGLFQNIQPKDTKVILPNAPVRSVWINGGARMQAWYDIISHKRSASLDYPEDEAGIQESTDMVTELINHEAKLVGGAHRIIIGGFSQGAAMSLHTGLRYPQKLGGIVACSGYLMLAKQYPAAIVAANRETPILAYHGQSDAVVGLDRAQASYTILQKAGVSVELTVEPGLTHSVSPRELRQLVTYFDKQFKAADIVPVASAPTPHTVATTAPTATAAAATPTTTTTADQKEL